MGRLDFFLVSDDIASLNIKTDITSGYRTDHNIITMALNLNNSNTRGRGFFKLNTTLLKDQEYINIIKECIFENVQRYAKPNQNLDNYSIVEFEISDRLFLDTLKMEIRRESIKYSAKKKREKNKTEEILKLEIEHLEENINEHNTNIILESLNIKKNMLEEFRKEKIKGMCLRAQLDWHEFGEKPTTFFCGLEKSKYIAKTIYKLEIDNKLITDQTEILQETKKYYTNLYSSKLNGNENEDVFLETNDLKQLNIEQQTKCEGLVNLNEMKEVLVNTKNNKSPGPDGIPMEFYKMFFNDINSFLIRSMNEAYRSGSLSITQKQGVITCLPKGDKPKQYLKNWRPINLLNCDYKLLSGVLSNRVKKILPDIIGIDQKGFIKDRYIGENTRLMYDVMEYLKSKKKVGLLLLIDFEKAFDSIEHTFIRKTLKKFNFGPDYIRWFDVIYNDVQSCVINNGHFSTFFNVTRGCRQGDPWSPYLFLLAAEPLAKAILKNINIKGINIGGEEYKIGQYADDTFILLDGDEQSLRLTVNTLNAFRQCSGLKINLEKTSAVWLGSKAGSGEHICQDLGLTWTHNFTLLGINFNSNLEYMTRDNLELKLKKIDSINTKL